MHGSIYKSKETFKALPEWCCRIKLSFATLSRCSWQLKHKFQTTFYWSYSLFIQKSHQNRVLFEESLLTFSTLACQNPKQSLIASLQLLDPPITCVSFREVNVNSGTTRPSSRFTEYRFHFQYITKHWKIVSLHSSVTRTTFVENQTASNIWLVYVKWRHRISLLKTSNKKGINITITGEFYYST